MSTPRPLLAPLALLTLVCSAGPVLGASEDEGNDGQGFRYPGTRAGEIAQAFLVALNSRDEATIRDFEDDYRALSALEEATFEERLEAYQQLTAALGSLTPTRVLEERPDGLRLLCNSSTLGIAFEVAFGLESDAPNKLLRLDIQAAAEGEALGPYDEWKDLADLLRQVRADAGVPALAAAVIRNRALTEQAVVGLRRVDAEGAEGAARIDDRFHVGSVAKSFTAVVVAALIERELLHWTTTLRDALPKVEMRPEFADKTIEDLLRHRARIPAHMTFDGPEMERLNRLAGSAAEQRASYVAEVLVANPNPEPGFAYSNAGFAIAGHIAESLTGKSWETLVAELVFTPLEMKTGGFGWPATADDPHQPTGHYFGAELRPQELDDEYVLGAFISPAGNIHCSVGDLARYAVFHLQGLAGVDGALRAETLQRLHTPAPSIRDTPYAGGWMIEPQGTNGAELHWHNGTVGTFYAYVGLLPEKGDAVVILMNVPDLGERVVGGAPRRAPHRWEARRLKRRLCAPQTER